MSSLSVSRAWLLVAVCVASVYLSDGACPAGWRKVGTVARTSNCFKIYTNLRKNFMQAQSYCQQKGGFLARITSASIQNALKGSIVAAGRTSTHPTSIWIGLTDNNKNSGPWAWIAGPNLGSYKHFVGNRNPNNTAGARDCGFVKPSEASVPWHVDKFCNMNRAVICQRPYTTTAPTVRTTTPKPVNCPRGWKSVPNKNTCIRLFVQPPRTWTDARTYCQQSGQGDLVKIGDGATNNFVKSQVNSQKGVYWIGLHDRHHENQFEWLDESTKATFTYWNSRMPNNAGGNENCVSLDGNHGSRWDDKSCQTKYRFICQRAPQGGTAAPRTGPTPPSSANCGTGWEDDPNTDNCYQFNIEPLSWLDARERCTNGGGDLASINSIQEQFYLTARTISFDSNFFWIGANDRSSESGYRWANGAPFAFINWDEKQPDNSHNSDCVAMVKKNGLWNDFPCANRNGYICEKKGRTTFTPLPTTTPPAHVPAGQMWGCPRGWDNYRGSCYRAVMDNVGVDWITANALCGAPNMGGTLASLTDSDENKFVSALIPHSYNGYVWIGFTDQLQEGTFTWVDGAPVTYTNWNNGEPNNQRNEDCGVTRRNGRWLDYVCTNQVKVFICKKSKALMSRDTAQESIGCVNGSLGFGAQCYTFVETRKDYGHAENDCRAKAGRGKIGHLATVDNSQLQGFLSAEMATRPSSFYWIGIRQYGYDYRWMSRMPVNFAYWGTNHTGSERYTCVAMQRNIPRGHWWNIPCNTNMSYICESPRTGFSTPVTKSTTPRPANCPKGWTSPRNSSYCFMGYQMNTTDLLSWTEARTFCGRLAPGGSLVTITDSYLENWLLTNILGGVNTTGNFWIGLNDRDTEFIYQWQDGSPFDYANWMDGQPDDFNNREDCVQWVLPDNKWIDNYCSVSFNWICQIPRGSAVPTTMPPPTGKTSSQCDNSSWIEYNNNCYFVSSDDGDMSASTWFEARVTCISLGGDLASITSSDENAFLTALISKTGVYDRWIGLTDLDSNSYRWSDLSPLSYVSWALNEPNDAFGGERCVEMIQDGTWNDLHCQAPIGYICKKRPGGGTSASLTSSAPPSGGCPVGFSTIPQVSLCYKVDGTRYNNRKNYDDAITACQQTASGAQLASIHSALDAKYVMTLVSSAQVWHNFAVWIGLNDRKIRNSFEWVDNSKVDFTFWAPNQPNENLKNDDPRARKDCVSLWGGGKVAGLWNDRPCSNHLAYVCATKKVPSLPTSPPNSDGCPRGYQRFGSSCYKFSADAYNWTSADGLCKADGGHLVSISNRYEQAFVELVTNHLDTVQFWVGFKYDPVAAAFKWVDGWPATFTNWGHDEPDQPAALGCVTHTVDGQWQSVGCDIQFPSVCEINLGTPPPAKGSGGGQCPNKSWFSYQGNCYKIESKNMKTWPGANYACSLMGAKLASVHSDNEARYLTKIIGEDGADLWIGLQKGQGVGFSWSDGSEAEYFYWGLGEPSDPDSFLHQDCVRVNSGDGTWGDVECTDSNGYLCKKPAVGYSTQSLPVTNKPVVTLPPPVTNRHNPPAVTFPDNVPTLPDTAKHQGNQGNPGNPGGDSDKDSGPSDGAVAGIVIGTLAGIALISVGGIFLFRRYKNQTPTKSPLGSENAGFDNATYSSQQGEAVNFSSA